MWQQFFHENIFQLYTYGMSQMHLWLEKNTLQGHFIDF
jgi:hypothetical protein